MMEMSTIVNNFSKHDNELPNLTDPSASFEIPETGSLDKFSMIAKESGKVPAEQSEFAKSETCNFNCAPALITKIPKQDRSETHQQNHVLLKKKMAQANLCLKRNEEKKVQDIRIAKGGET